VINLVSEVFLSLETDFPTQFLYQLLSEFVTDLKNIAESLFANISDRFVNFGV